MSKWKWKWHYFWAKSRLNSSEECGMAYTPSYNDALNDIYSLESYGIKNRWINKRTVFIKE
jgi:hypothetical protein